MNHIHDLAWLLALIAFAVYADILFRRQDAREQRLNAMVKSLINRISAKDLTSFVALEDREAEQGKPRPPPWVATDEAEADLQDRRRELNI